MKARTACNYINQKKSDEKHLPSHLLSASVTVLQERLNDNELELEQRQLK